MRIHISVPDRVLSELDRRVGPRGRSGFIVAALRRALDDERRWDEIEAALGGLDDTGHEWDDDPAGWVRDQRTDAKRAG